MTAAEFILIRLSRLCLDLAAKAIGGSAWKKAGLIWYRTLCDLLLPNATFAARRASDHSSRPHRIRRWQPRRKGRRRCMEERESDLSACSGSHAPARSDSIRSNDPGSKSLGVLFRVSRSDSVRPTNPPLGGLRVFQRSGSQLSSGARTAGTLSILVETEQGSRRLQRFHLDADRWRFLALVRFIEARLQWQPRKR